MEDPGLYKLAGVVLAALLGIGAAGYAMGEMRRGDAAAPDAVPAAVVADASLAPAAGAVCRVEGTPRPLGDEIEESSGVAASRAHDGIAWTHNDSGDPVLFAVGRDGRTVGRVAVEGASVEDWEDVARAPCPSGGDCLYVGDIGDNDAGRPFVTVYRIPEPSPSDSRSAPAAALRLRYPDGPHDAEALFVRDGAVHVVSKGETGPIAVYRVPAGATGEAVLVRVATLAAGPVDRPARVTAADASEDGRWIALRTLDQVAVHPASVLDGGSAPAARRVDLRPLGEPQGEGIAFTPDGGLVLTSESRGREPGTLARLACTLP